MQLHTLAPDHKTKKPAPVGRGGRRGKTSGHGTKGQKARAGHKIRPQARDIIKKLPKLRGHGKNRSRTVRTNRIPNAVINLATLEAEFKKGDTISPATLLKKSLVRRAKGCVPAVKILGVGNLAKPLTVRGCALSATAKKGIEAAGGTIEETVHD